MTGEPIHCGSISIEGERIVGVDDRAPAGAVDLGRVAIMPALVNAHTHLELSYLRGLIPPTKQFLDWIRTIMATRRQYPDAGDPRILDAARAAIAGARASGTGLLGDIFAGALSRFNNPVSLKRVADLIDETEWTALDVDVKAEAFEG